jgi:hypothetical protein
MSRSRKLIAGPLGAALLLTSNPVAAAPPPAQPAQTRETFTSNGVRFIRLTRPEMIQLRDQLKRFAWAWQASSNDVIPHDFGRSFQRGYDGRYDTFIEGKIIPNLVLLAHNLGAELFENGLDVRKREETTRWVYSNFFEAHQCFGPHGTLGFICYTDLSGFNESLSPMAGASPAWRRTTSRLGDAYTYYLTRVSDIYVEVRGRDAKAAAMSMFDARMGRKSPHIRTPDYDVWVSDLYQKLVDLTDRDPKNLPASFAMAPRGMQTTALRAERRKAAAARAAADKERLENEKAFLLLGTVLLGGFLVIAATPQGASASNAQGWQPEVLNVARDLDKAIHPFGFSANDLAWGRTTPTGKFK